MSELGPITGGRVRRPNLRLLAAVVGLGFGASILAALFDAGPIHALQCLAEGRDGWTVELPEDLTTPDDVRRAVQGQTSCVPVKVGYVDWGLVEDGELAVPINAPRKWVPIGGTINVWAEGTPAQASDPCAPLGPSTAPPAGCPGATLAVSRRSGLRTDAPAVPQPAVTPTISGR